MRILLYSRAFSPMRGGMERLVEVLAREFLQMGHEVTVVTETLGPNDMPFPVVRCPSALQFLRQARTHDVILSAPLSLRRLPVQWLSGRPIVIIHPLPFPVAGRHRLAGMAKGLVSRFALNIVPSRFMATKIASSRVIVNPYDAAIFSRPRQAQKRAGVLFVGRLIEEKGCDHLLRAFAHSAPKPLRLTIVGDGPERLALEQLALLLQISERVDFVGELAPSEVAQAMRTHEVMVVSSTCEEAFGIVALEGLATGCRMIVADTGGLPEAVGPFAMRYPPGDEGALGACLRQAFGESSRPDHSAVDEWLTQFAPRRIAGQYIEALASRLPQGPPTA